MVLRILILFVVALATQLNGSVIKPDDTDFNLKTLEDLIKLESKILEQILPTTLQNMRFKSFEPIVQAEISAAVYEGSGADDKENNKNSNLKLEENKKNKANEENKENKENQENKEIKENNENKETKQVKLIKLIKDNIISDFDYFDSLEENYYMKTRNYGYKKIDLDEFKKYKEMKKSQISPQYVRYIVKTPEEQIRPEPKPKSVQQVEPKKVNYKVDDISISRPALIVRSTANQQKQQVNPCQCNQSPCRCNTADLCKRCPYSNMNQYDSNNYGNQKPVAPIQYYYTIGQNAANNRIPKTYQQQPNTSPNIKSQNYNKQSQIENTSNGYQKRFVPSSAMFVVPNIFQTHFPISIKRSTPVIKSYMYNMNVPMYAHHQLPSSGMVRNTNLDNYGTSNTHYHIVVTPKRFQENRFYGTEEQFF